MADDVADKGSTRKPTTRKTLNHDADPLPQRNFDHKDENDRDRTNEASGRESGASTDEKVHLRSVPESTAAAAAAATTTSTALTLSSSTEEEITLEHESPSPSSRGQRGIRYSTSLSNANTAYATRRRKKKKTAEMSLRSVMQRVSHKAALSTKKAVWDSNDISLDAAVRAVDQWEALYNALRQCSILLLQQAQTLYRATKMGALQMEQGILRPVRDWIVLPAFGGMELAVVFLQSDQMHNLSRQSLDAIRCIPVLGEHVICPSLCVLGDLVQTTWHIVQYPIPSKQQVRDTVDFTLTSSKWALSITCRELVWYIKRADASFRRSLSHTQWKVMGTGPYVTLEDDATKQDVLAHITDRYCNLHPNYNNSSGGSSSGSGDGGADHDWMVTRYEFVADIKRHNPTLYNDLIRSGLLLKRGGALLQDDEWLKPCPIYRYLECHNFLIPEDMDDDDNNNNSYYSDEDDAYFSFDHTIASTPAAAVLRPLWFRLPSVNGKPPRRDAPWICFSESDQHDLEQRYRQMVLMAYDGCEEHGTASRTCVQQSSFSPTDTRNTTQQPAALLESQADASLLNATPETSDPSAVQVQDEQQRIYKHPTIAQWYDPDPKSDVLVDQQRQAVSIWLHCPTCQKPLGQRQQQQGEEPQLSKGDEENLSCVCQSCKDQRAGNSSSSPRRVPFTVPPPFTAVMRPTLWRFHGAGDAVIRSNWFLDTPWNVLQPFDESAQAALEDAYLFLKWISLQRVEEEDRSSSTVDPEKPDKRTKGDSIGGVLLTIEVTCPDQKDRLVQFGSLTHATAIQKGFGAAISINKLRVYRGAWLPKPKQSDSAMNGGDRVQPKSLESCLQDSIAEAAVKNGTLGETPVPNACLRSILQPPPEFQKQQQHHHREQSDGRFASSDTLPTEDDDLAVPLARLVDEDMASFIKDPKGGQIDHLCLIVHGIGEMMQSIDLFGLALPNLSTIVDCCDYLRKNHAEVLETDFSETYWTAGASENNIKHQPIGRVEYLPVEWHEAFSILSQRRPPSVSVPDSNRKGDHFMLKDISLPTIPKMREFANDTLMDVLYFMSPEHHDIIIDIVATEMNVVVEKFRQLTGFTGRVSIIGHSLGSIIAWDILANQRVPPLAEENPEGAAKDALVTGAESNGSLESLMSDYGTARSEPADGPETDRPPLSVAIKPTFSYPRLQFHVENFFLMGSPVAVFLMIRNQRKPLHDSFSLNGCRRVFNIFHPYDPVAYRIEPCIDPENANFEPSIIKHWNGGFRVQYQTKRLWRKLLDNTMETQQNVAEAFAAGLAGIGLLDATGDFGPDTDSDEGSEVMRTNYIVTGQLNGGRRIDYMLQEKEIETANEYVAALAAHSCYWTEKDLSLFVARQLSCEEMEDHQGNAWDLEH
ncbi:hypothetical protein ACA910_005994 [Epithemia clementina (nom. ined.)]